MSSSGGIPLEGTSLLSRLRDRDLTRGSLFTSLMLLSLPLLVSSSSGVMFQIVDLGFVTRLGPDATTAVIVTNQSLRQIAFMLLMGASFGAQGLIARHVGQGNRKAAEHVAGQVVSLGVLFSLALAIPGVLFPAPLLSLMNVSDAVLEISVPYVRLVFLLNFGFVFVFLFGAILSGAGDTTTPMVISILQAPVALLAEWCLVFGHLGAPALGVSGVALGIGVGQALGVMLGLGVLFRGTSRISLRLAHLKPDLAVVRRILGLSWPPAVQMVGSFLVTVFFIRLSGDFGEKAQTAYSIGLRLSMVGPMLAFPVAGACSTLVAQNLGAGHVPRAWRALRVGLATHVALLWSIALAAFLLRTPILRAFSDDPEVIRIGSELLAFQAGTFAAWAFLFVFFRVLQGAGDVAVPMLLSLGGSLLCTLPLGIWLSSPAGLDLGPRGIFAGTFLGSVVITMAMGAWLATGRWTRLQERASEATSGGGPEAGPGGNGSHEVRG